VDDIPTLKLLKSRLSQLRPLVKEFYIDSDSRVNIMVKEVYDLNANKNDLNTNKNKLNTEENDLNIKWDELNKEEKETTASKDYRQKILTVSELWFDLQFYIEEYISYTFLGIFVIAIILFFNGKTVGFVSSILLSILFVSILAGCVIMMFRRIIIKDEIAKLEKRLKSCHNNKKNISDRISFVSEEIRVVSEEINAIIEKIDSIEAVKNKIVADETRNIIKLMDLPVK
jgi:chromosome segregation ATPase